MRAWRYVVGSFAVRIPVTTPDVMLPAEENTLAIMKWHRSEMDGAVEPLDPGAEPLHPAD